MKVISTRFPAILMLLTVFCGGALCAPSTARAQGASPANSIWVEALNLTRMTQGWGTPHVARSVGGAPLTIAGVVYPHGVGTHALSTVLIDLHGVATRFTAEVGVDDEVQGKGSVVFEVDVDGRVAAKTPVLKGGDQARSISIDLTGAKKMVLQVNYDGGGNAYDHADWANALITLLPDASRKPETIAVADGPARMIVPATDPHPAIHGPRIVGATPGHPFLFLVPATGEGPLIYSAKNLPVGLALDPRTGIVSGLLRRAGRTSAIITVHGPAGVAHRVLTIVGGDHPLALTPPMGWNSWNVWAGNVDEGKVKAAADELHAAGLTAHGFQFVNIDDTWEAGRGADGAIETNGKFPDMLELARYVHRSGLKIGIYSSPGPKTCGGYTGSYQHEARDAKTYADWGFDYLKYDWCSYGDIAHGDSSLPALEKPYTLMGDELRKQKRDITFSLCQYGMGDVWKWGPNVDGNCWRTTGDIQDNWASLESIYNAQSGLYKYAGPGHWNDPDMLMVGIVGFGNTHPTGLKPNEQLLHISMWCMFSAPLLIGCDLTRLDSFTRALLTNDEVLDIDQDSLGQEAARVSQDGHGGDVWARKLWDGTRAVAMVNTSDFAHTVTARWSDIGANGSQPLRDLWLHKNLGLHNGSYTVNVPAHGVVLLKIGKPSRIG